MPIQYLYPEYEVVRNLDKCINCRACEKQCANLVHKYLENQNKLISDDSKCVNCQRCVAICPTRALKIVKSNNDLKENQNWSKQTIYEIYKQANTGGVLLSSMGNPQNYPVYFDKILINASQVTNPSIDPLREPMETKVFLGRKPQNIKRDKNGEIIPEQISNLTLSIPIMFSSYILYL